MESRRNPSRAPQPSPPPRPRVPEPQGGLSVKPLQPKDFDRTIDVVQQSVAAGAISKAHASGEFSIRRVLIGNTFCHLRSSGTRLAIDWHCWRAIDADRLSSRQKHRILQVTHDDRLRLLSRRRSVRV